MGFSVSNLIGINPTDTSEQTALIGISIGGLVEYPLNTKFTLESGLLFTEKGARFENRPGAAGDTILSNWYLELPAMLKWFVVKRTVKRKTWSSTSRAEAELTYL